MQGQKSQKGRDSAAQQVEETSRRINRPGSLKQRGRQQFGGVGQRTDRNVDQLSQRAQQAMRRR